MYSTNYSREKVEIGELGIALPDNDFIYYYEIVNIQISGLYEDSPSIIIYSKYNSTLKICYDSKESRKKLENELNYFIESMLED